ncbi:MAG: c-type cytochrome [Pseudomonadota bacterium]
MALVSGALHASEVTTELAEKPLGDLAGHGGPVKAVVVAGDAVLTGGFDYAMIHWQIAGKAPALKGRFDDHDGPVNAVALLADGRRAVTGADDGSITLWDLESGARLAREKPHTGKVLSIDVAPDGRRFVSASWDGSAHTFSLDPTFGALAPGAHMEVSAKPVNAAVFTADGSAVITASSDGRVARWHAGDGSVDRVIYRHGWGVNVLARRPGSADIIIGAIDGVVAALDAESGEITHRFAAHERPVLALAVLDKPGMIASGSGDGMVRVMRAGDGAVLDAMRNPYGPVWALAFHNAGALYHAGLDDVVHRWQFAPRDRPRPRTAPFPRRFQVGAEVSLGERQFARKCSVCHTLGEDGRNRAGPTLHKLFGRKIGTVSGYPYSPALANGTLVWSPKTLRELFTLGPEHVTPGTKMPLQRITDPEKITALIAYLEVATAPERSASAGDAAGQTATKTPADGQTQGED